MAIPIGGVELYRKGIKLKNDPATTEADWAEYREQLATSNARWAFRTRRADKIRVYESASEGIVE